MFKHFGALRQHWPYGLSLLVVCLGQGQGLQKCWPAKSAKGLKRSGLHQSPSICEIVFVPEKDSVHIFSNQPAVIPFK